MQQSQNELALESWSPSPNLKAVIQFGRGQPGFATATPSKREEWSEGTGEIAGASPAWHSDLRFA